MPEYKLVYFNLRGRGEIPRILFALAGIEYEDVRYTMDEWKTSVKDKFNAPFGQLPCLSVDGQMYGQSISICRYLAEKFGLAGKTDLDKLRADMVVHCIEEISESIFNAAYNEDESKREDMVKKLKDEELHTRFTYLENILRQNHGGDGYFVGDSLTWADVAFAHHSDWVFVVGYDQETFLSSYPKLKALKEKVLKEPKIAEWIAKRPVTKL